MFALYFPKKLRQKKEMQERKKTNLQQNTIHLEQQIYISPDTFTQRLLVMFLTFRSGCIRLPKSQSGTIFSENISLH